MTHANGFRHGYEIDRVEREGGKATIILTHEHGLRIDEGTTQEVYFPQRTVAGPNTFEIPLRAALTRN